METCAKHILLVDNELKIIEHVLKNTNWIIEVLVTINKNNKYSNISRVKKIYTEEDFLKNDNLSGFEYNDLNYLWHAQLKVENCFQRFLVDYQMGKWNYYRGYALVKQVYENIKLDMVIVKGFNHGHIWDRLITDFATYKGIVSYNIEDMLLDTRGVYNNYAKRLININDDRMININHSLFYKEKYEDNQSSNKGLWQKIYKLNYKFFGALGVDIIKCIRYGNMGNDRLGVSVLERVIQYCKIKNVKKYVDSVTVELESEKKYICFALHFEPEATIAGRAIMDSQIVAIRMIASNLPPNWILYVKEHPSQYEVNRTNFYCYLYGTAVFKTKRFYKEINSIKNVRLLKREISNKKILESCQAIATLSGTIAAEATMYRKPVMIFSAERTIFSLAKGFYCIYSYNDCKRAIGKIITEKLISYDDFEEICQKYLISFEDEVYGFRKAIDAIEKDIVKEEKSLF